MNKSASIANLALALCDAQKEMPVALFDSKNPFLSNKYASLGAVIETTKPIMTKFGLSISQFPAERDGRVGVTTILMHSSGEWLEQDCYLPVEKEKGVNEAQVAGRNITYLRRYGWASVLGAYADADTDGNSINASESAAANEMVKKVMDAVDEHKIESKRNWSDGQLDTLLEHSVGFAENHEQAREILNMSILPEKASNKLVESWFRHWLGSGKVGMIDRSEYANEQYRNAKKSGGK